MVTVRNSKICSLSLLSVTFLVILSACSDSSDSKPRIATADNYFEGEWQEHECQMAIPDGLQEENFRCGTFIVPKNWDFPETETRSFEVAVLRARNSPSKADPVVFFGGGPGAWNLEGPLPGRASYMSPLSETRDIVFFDKRGGGLSAPDRFCHEYFDQFLQAYSVVADGKADADAVLVGLQDCHTRLTSNGIDGSYFNSYQIAALMRSLA